MIVQRVNVLNNPIASKRVEMCEEPIFSKRVN